MVREIRIKELTFSSLTPTGSPFSSTDTSQPINGDILAVNWKSDNTGSVFITVSGTGEEVWRRNAPSGTGWQFAYPRAFTQSTTGSIASALHQPFVVNAPLIFNVVGGISGTLPFEANVRYR